MMLKYALLACTFPIIITHAAELAEVDVEICSLQSQDWKHLKSLRLKAAQENPIILGSTEEEEEKRQDNFYSSLLEKSATGNDTWLRFARLGNEYIGFIGARCERPEVGLMCHNATMAGFYVMKEFRKKIETGLLREMISTLSETPHIESVSVLISDTQQSTITLYKLHGFCKTGHITYGLKYDGDFYPQRIMEKRLDKSGE